VPLVHYDAGIIDAVVEFRTGSTVMHMHTPPDILILGNYRNALTVARGLGNRHRIILGGAGGAGRVEHSRFVTQVWPLPDIASAGFASSLDSALRNCTDVPVIFPIGDAELFALLSVPSVTEGRVKVVMPAPEVVAACLDKAANLKLATDLGIPQADFRLVKELSDLPAAIESVGCPCIIKSGHQMSLAFGKKAYHVSDPLESVDLISGAPENEHGFIVQKAATGLRHNVYFAAEHGRLVGAMEARVLRTNIFDGSGFTVESLSIPLSDALRSYTEQLVERLNYHGIGNTQFLVNREDGSISFLEISPRMGAAFALTVAAGFNFSQAGLNLAVGDPVSAELLPDDYRAGKRFAWSYGDLVGLLTATRQKEIRLAQGIGWLGRILRAAIRADIHATWSWKDPKPAFANVSAALGNVLSLSGASRSNKPDQ
jgi:predicted ATP-grasp superfamily ATP-dependent carboligase